MWGMGDRATCLVLVAIVHGRCVRPGAHGDFFFLFLLSARTYLAYLGGRVG